MEVEGEDGSKFKLALGMGANKALFGRGSGFNTDDRTVSRRHVSFQLSEETEPPRVSFEVIGRNPIWVLTNTDGTLRTFRKFDKGHLELGDRFCLSGKAPFWFHLRKGSESPKVDLHFDQVDVSAIDPVKEFGFLVMGHEFDQYPKSMIRNVENWEWFLEEPGKESSDEEDFEERRKMRRKRKAFKDNEDDEWTGGSGEDRDLVAKMGKGKISTRSKDRSTRSKDRKGPNTDVKASSRNSKRKKATSVTETVEDDDDETLGGFIVADVDEEEEDNNEDEEEEFEEEEDDDDDVVE